MAYWSSEDPDTFHTCKNCPSGRQILPRNRQTGTPAAYRKKCERCREYERDGVCE